MAVLSHPGDAYERLLWRKLTLRMGISEKIVDPKTTLVNTRSGHSVRANRCKTHNKVVGGSKKSQHLLSKVANITMSGMLGK